MKMYSDWQWLLIDAASQFGISKVPFEDRIDWTLQNFNQLEALAQTKQWKERPRYIKAVMAIRDAQAGKPIGHKIGLDASCSGLQIMSAMMGCPVGAQATGLVDPTKPGDAYTTCTQIMQSILNGHVETARDDVKRALMTVLYGSTKTPKDVFGHGTPALQAFYRAAYMLAPGAMELLNLFQSAWNKGALMHTWEMPDGFVVRIREQVQEETRISVEELGNAKFTYTYFVNKGQDTGLHLAANCTHSGDAMVMRELITRCNYDPIVVQHALEMLTEEQAQRQLYARALVSVDPAQSKAHRLIGLYNATGFLSARLLSYLNPTNMQYLSDEHLKRLTNLCQQMLSHGHFQVVPVHDEFASLPRNVNQMRLHYREVMANLAESQTVNYILSQLYRKAVQVKRNNPHLPNLIRQSAYGIH